METAQRNTPPPAGHDSYEQLEEQAARIRRRIRRLQLQLADIRACQNALVPINRIPDDVLWEILACLVQPASSELTLANCDLISATHVCRRWRRLAVDRPGLWTEIPLYTCERAALFLERSRDMPVRISLDLWKINKETSSDADYSPILIPHIQRLRAFSLHNLYRPDIAEWWMFQLSVAAPLLEELSLSANSEVYIEDVSIFGGHTPSLQTLSLECVKFPPSSPIYEHLRHLSVSTLDMQTRGVSELLQILRHAVNLEVLVLRNLIFEPDNMHDHNAPPQWLHAPVALSRLSLLEISSGWMRGNPHSILAHLSLPITAQIKFDMGVCLLTDVRLPSNPTLAHLRALELVMVPEGCPDYTFRGWQDPESLGTQCSFSLCGSLPFHPYFTLMFCLSEMLDVSAVVSYRIVVESGRSPPHVWHEQRWDLALRGLGALKTLSIDIPRALQHYAYLFRALSAHSNVTLGLPTCPSLEELEIVGAYCDEAFWAELEAMLQSRRASGCPLRSVRIKDAIGVVDATALSIQEIWGLLDDFQLAAAEGDDTARFDGENW